MDVGSGILQNTRSFPTVLKKKSLKKVTPIQTKMSIMVHDVFTKPKTCSEVELTFFVIFSLSLCSITQAVMTFVEMSAKLIIEKFETGINFKSLHVTFGDGESDIKYSEWFDGITLHKRKESLSRLVVKIVSGNEIDAFNLDSCAKAIDGLNSALASDLCEYTDSRDTYTRNEVNIESNLDFKLYETGEHEKDAIVSSVYRDISLNTANSFVQSYPNGTDRCLSPLEYSLEKVKENNARIMENIHMLNRTLNYTKKKENLDIVCTKSMRSYPCNSCGKCFVYETGLRRHYSMRHAMTEVQPRWQIVWTCLECFQVWPRHDLAVKHSVQCGESNIVDCVREIKTSSLLQCEFCEKVFTSIPRLLRHSKLHVTARNYECNSCEISFSSYKTAEQHWLSCSWLKIYYCFSLPKLLLCNTCDRKFRTYDQLYNHRYKVGHFMTKVHCNQSINKSVGVLVYQCEICGQWFASIAPLQAHRVQYHPRYDNGSIMAQIDSNRNESNNNPYDVDTECASFLQQMENN